MARRIIGITGIGLWFCLIVLVVGLQTTANGSEKMFENLPEGWKIEKSYTAPKTQTAAFSNKLGGKIKKLTNTVLSYKGQQIQVNVIYCPDGEQAEKVYKTILKAQNGNADNVIKDDKKVVEFTKCNDVMMARKARKVLGLELARLDSVACKIIKKIPDEWVIIDSFIVPQEKTKSIGEKLNWEIKKLSNTIFKVHEKRFQVNTIECMTLQEAEIVQENILKMKADPAFCLRYGNTVVEFVGDDIKLAKKAVYALGIEIMPIEDLAKDLVDSLASSNYKKAVENFDDTMKTVLPADKLKEVWNSLTVQSGAFVEQRDTRNEKIMGYDVIFVTCKFEKAVLDAKVVFNDKKQVAGLFFVPTK